MKTRIYFLDNLRTFLIFLVIVLHAGMTYESGFDAFWIVSDPAKYNPLAWVRTYLDLFIMFSLFFISGYFIPLSVRNKDPLGFLRSKFNRIMLPWVIAVYTLIPAYKAIFLFSRDLPQEKWFSYFHLFQRTGTDLSFFANNPTQNWLWFLPVLFLFQVLYLAMSKTNLLRFRITFKTGVILTFIIGLIYSMIISTSGLSGWAHSPLLDFQRERLLVYFMVFLLGSLGYKLKIFEINRKQTRYLVMAIAVLIPSLLIFTKVAFNLFNNIIDPTRNYFYVSEIGDRIIYYASVLLSMLSFLYILVYIFRFGFNRTNHIINSLNRNSYHVYIIHMIVLGVVALIMVPFPVPVLVKYSILIILTFSISNAIVYAYQKIIRKTTSKKWGIVIIVLASILTVIVYVKQAKSNKKPGSSSMIQTTPAMGIHEAAIRGNLEAIYSHIMAGSNLDEKEPSGGASPLIIAATFGKANVALALIEAGADVNFINNEGSTPLHTAAFFCRVEIVEALLNHGADKSIKNHAGSTALESVSGPFDTVKGIYDYLGKAYGPLGLELDYERVRKTRPIIAELLK